MDLFIAFLQCRQILARLRKLVVCQPSPVCLQHTALRVTREDIIYTNVHAFARCPLPTPNDDIHTASRDVAVNHGECIFM